MVFCVNEIWKAIIFIVQAVLESDLEISGEGRGGGGNAVMQSSRNLFRPYWPQFGLEIKGEPGPPGPSPGSAAVQGTLM